MTREDEELDNLLTKVADLPKCAQYFITEVVELYAKGFCLEAISKEMEGRKCSISATLTTKRKEFLQTQIDIISK